MGTANGKPAGAPPDMVTPTNPLSPITTPSAAAAWDARNGRQGGASIAGMDSPKKTRRETKDPRRVSVSVDYGGADPPHNAAQPMGIHRHPTAVSNLSDYSSDSRGSSLNLRPRLSVEAARSLLLNIFLPRPGRLECIESQFITEKDYAEMQSVWAGFLKPDLRDKWYLDAVMLSVLGKDRWRSSRQQSEILMAASLTKEQVHQLDEKRRGYNERLRERLMELSGALKERQNRRRSTPTLQTLLNEYHRHRSGEGPAPVLKGKTSEELELSHTTSDTTASSGGGQYQELLSLSLMRLQTAMSTSFDCYELLASRIPTTIVSNFPSKYFVNSTPVVYPEIAYQEKKVGDLNAMSFFVSIESRRRLLNEQPSLEEDEEEDLERRHGGGSATTPVGGRSARRGDDGPIRNAQMLYAALRHAGLVVTTACSSLVLNVLFHLSEVIRERRAYRENKAKAEQLGISLEQLTGRKAPVIAPYTGKHTEDFDELKRYAVTGELSLAIFAKHLVDRFRKDNRAKVVKLRKLYPNLFAFLETMAPAPEQDDFDATRILTGMILKLMYLFAGGQRSIEADDCRVPLGSHQVTDDVALSVMLEVPILSRICWITSMMGMPILTRNRLVVQENQSDPPTFKEIDECCGVMRILFQAIGALPCGAACPLNFQEWFRLFPLYAVNSEGKRALMYLYTAQVTAIKRIPLTIQKDMTLLSFATAFQQATSKNRVDVMNYFFEPKLTVGYSRKSAGSNVTSSSGKDKTPSRRGTHATPNLGSRDGSPRTSNMGGYSFLDNNGGNDEAGSASSRSSCSTLLDDNADIDAYTCVNVQTQLYMRCSNEATMRRHRITELTPSVSATFFHSSREVVSKRPGVAAALLQQVPRLMPSEGFLVISWIHGEPLVTFRKGDVISVMAERAPLGHRRPSSRHFNKESGNSSSQYNNGSVSPSAGRRPIQKEATAAAAAGRTLRSSAIEATVNQLDSFYGGYYHYESPHRRDEDPTGDDANENADFTAPERTRVYQGVMHDLLGVSERVGKRLSAQWSIMDVYPVKQLLNRGGSPKGGSIVKAAEEEALHHHEVILHVTSLGMPISEPISILTIGHERASMSVFTYLSKSDDSVCWANPHLIESIVGGHSRDNCSNTNLSTPIQKSGLTSPLSNATVGGAKRPIPSLGPSGLLCNSESELHTVFYSIGILLGNAITNAVYFSIPLAPLAFFLIKKALSSGDYSFRSFMWLEPSNGNLLSPSLVLNFAYEILAMTDEQYITFLQSRGLVSSEEQVFPVRHSLAAEARQDRESQMDASQGGSSDGWPPSAPPRPHPDNLSLRSSVSHQRPSVTRSVTSSGISSTSAKMKEYWNMISDHNRSGTTLRQGGGGSKATPLLTSPMVSIGDRLQSSRDRMSRDKAMADGRSGGPAIPAIYDRLPSREEYIALYLVNDLTWSSVRRDGNGNKNKELWVSMARGFMATSVAKSPLMRHCSSRVIREVLCVPVMN